jgi:hypothetical protein
LPHNPVKGLAFAGKREYRGAKCPAFCLRVILLGALAGVLVGGGFNTEPPPGFYTAGEFSAKKVF